jgi:hypothetical protein
LSSRKKSFTVEQATARLSAFMKDERVDGAPLFAQNAASAALLKELDVTLQERTETSPARAFCKAIGMDPPPAKLVFNASFFAATPYSVAYPHVWQVKADSTKDIWFQVRANEKWQWRWCDPQKDLVKELGPGLVRVTLRARTSTERSCRPGSSRS